MPTLRPGEGKKYLQVSTDEVYGALCRRPLHGDHPAVPHSPILPPRPALIYFVMAFHDTYGMPVNITRCSTTKLSVPGEVASPLTINNVSTTSSCPCTATACGSRDWLYVEDRKAIDMVGQRRQDRP